MKQGCKQSQQKLINEVEQVEPLECSPSDGPGVAADMATTRASFNTLPVEILERIICERTISRVIIRTSKESDRSY